MANTQGSDRMANYKCFFAIFLVSMSPFQYGVDFGLIGGIQAMIGFLKVLSKHRLSFELRQALIADRYLDM